MVVEQRPQAADPVLVERGHQIGVQGRERDITERRMREETLRQSEQSLRVSEEVLEDAATGALYVFARVMSPRAVLGRLEALAG